MHEITLNEVRQLIASLRTVYAAQFNKQFPATGENAIPMSMVEQIALKTLVGVQQNQFNNALARLLTAGGRFMPSFAEFRTWCIGECWMSPEEAWSRACKFTADRSVVITQITKYALDEVMYLIEAGQMRAAQENFFGTYNVMVAKAQLKGRQQEFYTPPLQLEHKEPKHVPVSNDVAQKHLKSLMERLKINGRKTAPVQKLQAKEKEPELAKELGPDPFDNPHEYAEMCRREGMPIPRNILQLINGASV
ncbi:hypothetical protein HLH91_06125 [Acinetobacter baumannii]|uniref:hypothetical protein n=1 Tax=Acinetobacter baumannii TaxID=470 RepID=UPI000B954253|nr:hypothetical protein [Acinetobacter baumannii]EKU0288881.1 hypothetical protein [Acinetobacter baumannii]EKU1774687.1 hypothetical protein [Acinetobacter baumannii]EKU2525834.1 hypothetical protein [Acinetobacter baumannii]EKV2356262.1 hypothetical protein [Acinetobacter baumannii]EKX5514625.1 hypothetical protein [Acinetobacter baumannii]